MADLSSVININAVLDNSVPGTPVIRIIDTSAYPGGVPPLVKGCLLIIQPDGIPYNNTNFAAPDIQFTGGSLNQAVIPLRLATNNRFQNGGYLITYTVQAAGYTNTVLTKTFVLNYTAPVPVLSNAFDNFTPHLTVTDATNWGVSGLSFVSVTDTWAGLIRSVTGTNQAITGAGGTFDLAFGGSYYDAVYDISLTSIVTWQIPGISSWVTIVDNFQPPLQTFTTEIPPTLAQLLTSLTILKSQLDAGINNNQVTQNLLQSYTFAVSIYTHLIDRGQSSQLAGLSQYVYQLQMIFNNGVTPTYINTNTVIPAYVWGGGAGSATWASISGKPSTVQINWTVGQGGFPGNGATALVDARLSNIPASSIVVFRGGIPDTSWTKPSTASNTINFVNAFSTGEPVIVLVLPL